MSTALPKTDRDTLIRGLRNIDEKGRIPIGDAQYAPGKVRQAISRGLIHGIHPNVKLSAIYQEEVNTPHTSPLHAHTKAKQNTHKTTPQPDQKAPAESQRRSENSEQSPTEYLATSKYVDLAILAYEDKHKKLPNRLTSSAIKTPPFCLMQHEGKPITWKALRHLIKNGGIEHLEKSTELGRYAQMVSSDRKYEREHESRTDYVIMSSLIAALAPHYKQHYALPNNETFEKLTKFKRKEIDTLFNDNAIGLIGWYYHLGFDNLTIFRAKNTCVALHNRDDSLPRMLIAPRRSKNICSRYVLPSMTLMLMSLCPIYRVRTY